MRRLYAIMLIFLCYSSSSSSSSSLAMITNPASEKCFESIVSFGDSLTDNGNCLVLYPKDNPPESCCPPYGRTFFHRPTGRFSDGRIVLDFIAESLGVPLVPPYFGGERTKNGVNFAVAGARALDYEYYQKIGITGRTNVSLSTQLDWFKQFLATIPDNKEFLKKSLIYMGETGGNDYNHLLNNWVSHEEIQSLLVPTVIDYVGFAIEELIKLGAETLLIPGNMPIGCLPIFLTQFMTTSSPYDYDPTTGCLNWLNNLAALHNQLLQKELHRIRRRFPHVSLIYADYYNSLMRIYLSPDEFGFSKKNVLSACCGSGGPYNYNSTATCGSPTATSCDDPSSFVCWDALHLTEAANRLIALGFTQGSYSIPHKTPISACLNRINIYET